MIIKAPKKELDAIQKACVTSDLLCNFFTIESNDNLVQVEILNLDGSEVKPEYIWYVARAAQLEFEKQVAFDRMLDTPIDKIK